MENTDIINQTIKIYFQGGDWTGYLKKEVRKSRKLEDLIKNIV